MKKRDRGCVCERVCVAGTDGAVAFCWHVSVLRCEDVCVYVWWQLFFPQVQLGGECWVLSFGRGCLCVCVCVCMRAPGSSSRETRICNYCCRKTLANYRRIRHSVLQHTLSYTHTHAHNYLPVKYKLSFPITDSPLPKNTTKPTWGFHYTASVSLYAKTH